MPSYEWAPLALADGTAITSSNVNAIGNGPNNNIAVGQSGGTMTALRNVTLPDGSVVDGVRIAAAAAQTQRLDVSPLSGTPMAMAVECVLRYNTSLPAGADQNLFWARNSASSDSGIVSQRGGSTNHDWQARSAVSGALNDSVDFVLGEFYWAKFVSIVGASTTTGRVMTWFKGLTTPGWNGGEWFYDSAYTVNTGTTALSLIRVGKPTSATASIASLDILRLRWRDLTTIETSTTRPLSESNFVQPIGPDLSIVTSDDYWIYGPATPRGATTVTWSITHTGGTSSASNTPTLRGPGIWTVPRASDGTQIFDVTATGSDGGVTTISVTVPTLVPSSPFFLKRRVAGVFS